MAANQEKANMAAAENLLTSDTKIADLSSSDYSMSTEENGRHHWGRKAEYILAAVGFCVGLGNIWRFPYVCMKNGGGAFLIPFFLSLMVCAMPVYFLESAMGQFNGRSCYHVWSMSPLFKGIGLSMNAISFFCAWYYSMILGWTLIYLGHSFMSPLPWMRCDQAWNTPNCVTELKFNDSLSPNQTAALNGTEANVNTTRVSSTEEFWM